jgi:hypothetical protein
MGTLLLVTQVNLVLYTRPHDAEAGKTDLSRGTPVFAEWIGVLEALIMDSIEGYWPLPVDDTGATKSGGRS